MLSVELLGIRSQSLCRPQAWKHRSALGPLAKDRPELAPKVGRISVFVPAVHVCASRPGLSEVSPMLPLVECIFEYEATVRMLDLALVLPISSIVVTYDCRAISPRTLHPSGEGFS